MLYCSIYRTNCSYDEIFYRMKLIQLENDAKFGEVFDNYILCEQGNPRIYLEGDSENDILKKGTYVNLVPLDLISILVSDSDNLILNEFDKYEQRTSFYPLLGFEVEGDNLGKEIIDYDHEKEIIDIKYYYIKRRSNGGFIES